MKTKFSQLVKVKKRKVDEIESELLDIQNQKRRVESEIESILQEIRELKTPQNGDFAKLNLSYSYLSNFSNQKKSKEEELIKIDNQIEVIKELYKEANIEYEKIKYLDEQEIKKQLEELKIKENKDMDEIANLLHAKKIIEEEV
jgi:flagellar export protein FliJ